MLWRILVCDPGEPLPLWLENAGSDGPMVQFSIKLLCVFMTWSAQFRQWISKYVFHHSKYLHHGRVEIFFVSFRHVQKTVERGKEYSYSLGDCSWASTRGCINLKYQLCLQHSHSSKTTINWKREITRYTYPFLTVIIVTTAAKPLKEVSQVHNLPTGFEKKSILLLYSFWHLLKAWGRRNMYRGR